MSDIKLVPGDRVGSYLLVLKVEKKHYMRLAIGSRVFDRVAFGADELLVFKASDYNDAPILYGWINSMLFAVVHLNN